MVFCALVGCANDYSGLDTRAYRLLDERTAAVGGAALPPETRPSSTVFPYERSLSEKIPPTANVDPTQMRFTPADEARDVERRLIEFQSSDQAGARRLDLPAALSQAQRTSREYLNREEEYLLAAIALLIERHQWDIRLFHEATAAFSSTQTDGDSETTLSLVNQLAATKRLPFGGEVAARWVWSASENLRGAATEQYRQSSSLVLDGSVPLLRGFGDAARESLIQAERSLVYAARDFEGFRREFAVGVAREYFALLQQQASIENNAKQLESLDLLERKQRALFEAGRVRLIDVNNAANQARGARASLRGQQEGYVLALDRFKIRLGLTVTEAVAIDESRLDIPDPDVSPVEAAAMALAYRLDLQNQRDQVDDARRAVRVARDAVLPDLNLSGEVRFATDADAREGGLVYEPDDVSYGAAVRFSLPLDRRVERLGVRRAIIALQQRLRDFDRARDTAVLEARARVRAIELARFNLQLANERVALTELRKREQQLREDEIDTQFQLDALNDLLAAENARDQARTDLQNAILDYLLATSQLRINRDGQIVLLPGMTPPPEPR